MKIALGCDAAGFPLKEAIKPYLEKNGHDYVDCGCHTTESCHYPEFGEKAATLVADGTCERGLLFCGTGIGMGMVANKLKGVRCASASDAFSVTYTRLHNDANMLALGARVIGPGLSELLVDLFLTTEFEGGRHAARVDMIRAIEDKNFK